MIFVILNFALAILVATLVGEKRQIGQSWSFFFCITFSFLIGLIITIFSPQKEEKAVAPKKSNNAVVVLLVLLGLLMTTTFVIILPNPDISVGKLSTVVSLAFGFFGAAIYVKNPNLITI